MIQKEASTNSGLISLWLFTAELRQRTLLLNLNFVWHTFANVFCPHIPSVFH